MYVAWPKEGFTKKPQQWSKSLEELGSQRVDIEKKMVQAEGTRGQGPEAGACLPLESSQAGVAGGRVGMRWRGQSWGRSLRAVGQCQNFRLDSDGSEKPLGSLGQGRGMT